MTREEKEEILYNYCECTPCDDCVLVDKDWSRPCNEPNCINIDQSDEDELDRAIMILCSSKNEKSIKDFDPVNKPAHYNDGNIEVIEYIEDKKFNYHLGNAIKYISRAGKKDKDKTVEDLKKAIWYINRYIQFIEKGVD